MLSNKSTYCKYYVFDTRYLNRSDMTKDAEQVSSGNNRHPKKKRRFISKLVRWALVALAVGLVALAIAMGGLYLYLSKDLPKITSLSAYRPATITEVFSDDQRKIGEFYTERRIVIPLSEIPQTLKDSFIAAEDARFFKHKGIDFDFADTQLGIEILLHGLHQVFFQQVGGEKKTQQCVQRYHAQQGGVSRMLLYDVDQGFDG